MHLAGEKKGKAKKDSQEGWDSRGLGGGFLGPATFPRKKEIQKKRKKTLEDLKIHRLGPQVPLEEEGRKTSQGGDLLIS